MRAGSPCGRALSMKRLSISASIAASPARARFSYASLISLLIRLPYEKKAGRASSRFPAGPAGQRPESTFRRTPKRVLAHLEAQNRPRTPSRAGAKTPSAEPPRRPPSLRAEFAAGWLATGPRERGPRARGPRKKHLDCRVPARVADGPPSPRVPDRAAGPYRAPGPGSNPRLQDRSPSPRSPSGRRSRRCPSCCRGKTHRSDALP